MITFQNAKGWKNSWIGRTVEDEVHSRLQSGNP